MNFVCILAAAAAFSSETTARYLAVPIENGAPKVKLEVFDGSRRIANFKVEWARAATNWTASVDLGRTHGRRLDFKISGDAVPNVSGADLAFADSRFPAPKDQFREPWRPQLHFTPPLGWNNDPNGLSWRNGEWHMFYQYNPVGVAWDNMSWGHAVSKDLVHWSDLGYAIAPDDAGMAFSGSAVVDAEDTAGFGKGAHVLVYTAARGKSDQRLAWSMDGRSYTILPKPVVPVRSDALRDPKVFWYAPGRHWVMAVYGRVEKGRHCVSLFKSRNLVDWELASHVPGDVAGVGFYLYECPDLFELPIRGEKGSRWVLTAGNRQYAIGTFDGTSFRPEEERLEQMTPFSNLRSVYAWQTFSGAPDGRCVQIAWSRFETIKRGHKGAMFSQGMTLPVELSLVRTPAGLRMARAPVRELELLREGEATALRDFDGELAEVEFSCRPVADSHVILDMRGIRLTYNAYRKTLTMGNLSTAWSLDADGRLGFRIFVDRVGMEIFSLDGLQYLPLPDVCPKSTDRKIAWSAGGSKKPVSDVKERVWRLKSAVCP